MAGLLAKCGTFAFTRGVFRTTTFVDPELNYEPVEIQRFVLAHETHHVAKHHGFWGAVFLPIRPILAPYFEAAADRYATKVVGEKAAQDAMRRIMPFAPSRQAAWLYGWTWRERAHRAGIVA